jgi:CheY-like chemotaxis protein
MPIRILLVDDDAQWLDVFRHLIGSEYSLSTATNVSDALNILHSLPDIRLLITDLVLPTSGQDIPTGPDGISLLRVVRSEYPALPIIVVSAYSSEYSEALYRSGVTAFVDKTDSSGLESMPAIIKKTIAYSGPPDTEKAIDDSAVLAKIREVIVEEFDKYAPVKEQTIYIPREGSFELIKPLVGFKRDIEKQITRFPFSENVFLMMKFRASNRELSEYIVENLSKHGLRGIRADHEEWNITKNVYNPIAALYCCKYGIALFDEPEANQAYSANVAYELGMMHYQNKNCLILRHTSLPSVPFDLIKDLYEPYERDLQVRRIIDRWIKQIAIHP